MIVEIALIALGGYIWKVLQDDPNRARRNANQAINAARNRELNASTENLLDRRHSRTQVRLEQVDTVNTAAQAQRRVRERLNRDLHHLRSMAAGNGQDNADK